MYDKNYVGNKLKSIRLDRDISANQLSLKLSLNPTTISKIETGNAYPSFEVFFKICEQLDISPSEFFNNSPVPLKLSPEQEKLIANVKDLTDEQLSLLNQLISSFKSTSD